MSEPGTFVGGFDNNAAPGAERYWEGRWREEKAENGRLRDLLSEVSGGERPEMGWDDWHRRVRIALKGR
ncbi:hypothetical protein [Magnetospirillum sp. XM-1]|uniref:hypothetical protein n=1 Tax=Magnetospirillum sp. XM-1 TaxID=1663591 RepID=UPI0008380259|nr:hypothetical protein [Magnetospirillum sp. XM-1]